MPPSNTFVILELAPLQTQQHGALQVGVVQFVFQRFQITSVQVGLQIQNVFKVIPTCAHFPNKELHKTFT